ncbi:hypothetical protein [Spiroplasma endosymbiont of Aspidapion aeneum]|uniref:hypothetical protein n=1 Tax=Spiroplasma endosymbiont of Aspidapion aeneum TaxID=3066276 RepID=UPI00313C8E01
MLKTYLSITTAMSIGVTTASTTAINITQNDKNTDYYQNLYDDIRLNSKNLGSSFYTEYDNQKFYSEDEFDGYLAKKSLISQVTTTSNPSKIVKDYENQTLDPNKIYDTNINKAHQVFRDAFGNIAMSANDALNTYTNEGLVKDRYSYDNIDWYASPEEAKISQKDKLNIQSSIFYLYKDRYYNAFNTKDISQLLNRFEDGYYVNINKNYSGQPLSTNINLWGNAKDIHDKLRDSPQLKDDFISNYYKNAIDFTSTNVLTINCHGSHELRVKYDNQKEETYKEGSPFKLKFANKYKSDEEMLNDFKCKKLWNQDNMENHCLKKRNYWTRKMEILDNNGEKQDVTLELWASELGVKDWSNYTSTDDFKYTFETEASITPFIYNDNGSKDYLTPIKYLPGRYTKDELTIDEKDQIYNIWFDNYFDKILTNFSYGKNDNIDWNNKEVEYNDLLQEKYIKNNDGTVLKDKLFALNEGIGKKYSLIQAMLEFKDKKAQLLRNPHLINGVKKYEIRPDFFATEDDLNIFLPLIDSMENRVKYFESNNNKFSDQECILLSNTQQEALEKSFVNANISLKKRYIAYDVFGNSITSGVSEDDAVRRLQNNLSIESRMVSDKEYNSWNLNYKKDFSSIISDGIYVIYRIQDPCKQDNYLYYPSFELALKAFKSSLRIENTVFDSETETFLYNYIDKNNKQVAIIYYNNDIDGAINQIKKYNKEQ